MVGYSEIVNVMAAMVLFSLILLTSNKMILLNSMHEVESEAEVIAINLAQDIIDEARVKPFDENSVSGPPSTIPAGFTNCGREGESTRAEFDDFDDYEGWKEEVNTVFGSNTFNIGVGVRYVPDPNFDFEDGSITNPGDTFFKKMRVTVTSEEYLTDGGGNPVPIELEYLRRYYKQAN